MTAPIRVEPWAAWVAELSADLRRETAGPLRPLLNRLFDLQPTEPAQRAALGLAGRRLLAFGLVSDDHQWVVADAVRVVSATYDTAPGESEQLLRRLFTPERLAAHGHAELRVVADVVTMLAPHAPTLVRDLYAAAFAYEETSSDETQFGSGPVMPLRSNRRQDYEGGLYVLAQEYPAFLAAAPAAATSALIAVVARYAARERYWAAVAVDRPFDAHGLEARVRADGSGVWDRTSHRHEEPLQLLDTFAERLTSLAVGTAPAAPRSRRRARQRSLDVPSDARVEGSDALSAREQLEEIVATVLFENRSAAVWRRLLEAGTAHPAVFHDLLGPLAWATPLLAGDETSVAAGAFLTAVYPLLSPDERERVEYTLLHLSPTDAGVALDGGDDRAARRAEYSARHIAAVRARLLGCLPHELVTTPEAQAALAELRAQDAVPENRDEPLFIEVREISDSARTVTEELLAHAGVNVAAAPNRELLDLLEAADAFSSAHMNAGPTRAGALEVLPTLQAINEHLADAALSAPELRRQAATALARACARIARGGPDTCDGELGTFVRQALLAASQSERPDAGEGDAHSALNGWTPAPRTEAAEGLSALCRREACCTPDVHAALAALRDDPAETVRMQVFWHLTDSWTADRGFVWASLEHVATAESSPAVLHAALHGALFPLRDVDPSRVARLTAAVQDRAPAGDAGKEVRKGCAALLMAIALLHGDPTAQGRLARLADDPGGHAEEVQHVLHHLRNLLVIGDPHAGTPPEHAARRRAIDAVARIATNAAAQFSERRAAAVRDHPLPLPEPVLKPLRDLASVLDGVGAQLFFAAKNVADGAPGSDGAVGGDEEEPAATPAQVARLYTEAGAVVDTLADVGLAHLAHHLLEFLERVVPHDPAGVLVRVARVVRSGRADGYQYDSLAQGVVLRLARRYLAEYRDVVEHDVACRAALLDVLDIFVEAGWPEARQLSYRLDEVYR